MCCEKNAKDGSRKALEHKGVSDDWQKWLTGNRAIRPVSLNKMIWLKRRFRPVGRFFTIADIDCTTAEGIETVEQLRYLQDFQHAGYVVWPRRVFLGLKLIARGDFSALRKKIADVAERSRYTQHNTGRISAR